MTQEAPCPNCEARVEFEPAFLKKDLNKMLMPRWKSGVKEHAIRLAASVCSNCRAIINPEPLTGGGFNYSVVGFVNENRVEEYIEK